MPEILLVDDNEEILTANDDYLSRKGYKVTCLRTGVDAVAILKDKRFDCVVLDVLLPDMDGFTICKAVRTHTNTTPIIFLSCLDDTDDIIKGLMSGGDDYMTKPFSMKELEMRIRVRMRQNEQNGFKANETAASNIVIDEANRILHIDGKIILLSEQEFKLFMTLYENPNVNFTKEDLLIKIWNKNADISNVATLVKRLRKKIDFAEKIIGKIESHYNKGYCFALPPPPGS